MTRWCGVKCEAELQQERCLHLLQRLDPIKEHGFRWHCVKCGGHYYRKNGVEISPKLVRNDDSELTDPQK